MPKNPELVDKVFIFILLMKQMLKELLGTDEFKEIIREISNEEIEEEENPEPVLGEQKELQYYS